MAKDRLEGRIRYYEDFMGRGEHIAFECKWTNEEDWGLDTAFPLKNDMIHETALGLIRKWMDWGIPFRFYGGTVYSQEENDGEE